MSGAMVGRVEELRRLRAAVHDPDRRLLILRGPAGVGKSALAASVLRAMAAEGAVTGRGKYAEGDAQSPFEPLVQAFGEAVGAALDQMYEPQAALAGLTAQLGPGADTLRRLGFDLALEPGAGATPAATGRREGTAMAIDALTRLAGWLDAFGPPVVLLIDDWRRNAPEGRRALEAVIEAAPGMTLLLTERDDGPPHALSGRHDAWTLPLGPLRPSERRALLAELGVVGAAASRLAALGLPYDILAAAQAAADGRAEPDEAAAFNALPRPTRDLAVAAALWGDRAPVVALRLALGLSADDFEAAAQALSEAGLAQIRAETLELGHDRIRAAILKAAAEERTPLAGRMAERLAASERSPPTWLPSMLQLRAAGGLEGIDAAAWRDRFAAGAMDARARRDRDAANLFAEIAWCLAEASPAPAPELAQAIRREAMFAAADQRAPMSVRHYGADLVAGAADDTARGQAYELTIGALRTAGDRDGAWALAREALARFGLRLPVKATPAHLLMAAAAWRLWPRRRAAAGGADLDGLTHVAQAAATLGFERDPAFAVLITLRAAPRAARTVRAAAFWSSIDAFIAALMGRRAIAAQLGAAALEGLSADSLYPAATHYRALFFGQIWVRPLASLGPELLEIQRRAIAEGDLTTAAIAIRNGVLLEWRIGAPLPRLLARTQQALREAERIGDADILDDLQAQRAVAASLAGLEAPLSPEDPVLDGAPLLALELASFQGDWPMAALLAARHAGQRRGADSHPGGVVWRFHEALARLKTGAAVRRADLAFLAEAAALNPVDHGLKLDLVLAERLGASGRAEAALEAFGHLIERHRDTAAPHELSLALRCAAEAARAANQPDLAAAHDARARAAWAAWGADRLAGVAPAAHDPALIDARARTAAAEREAQAKARFLAEVAHELRTPMQGMASLLDLAEDDPNRLDLTTLRDIFESLRGVVDDLADYGVLAAGGPQDPASPVVLADLARAEAAPFAATVAAAGGHLSLRLANDLPGAIFTDGRRVRQVLRNLLSNAVKYGAGEPITFSVDRVASGGDTPDEIAFTVEDFGPGLSESDLVRIFEPFERGARAGDGQGLGLGLAISRRIAEQLDGGLWAETRNEGGARFSFRIPSQPVPEAPPRAAQPRAQSILLCEDVTLVRDALAELLRGRGHQVEAVADGASAWRAWRARPFDIALVDWMAPGLSGAALVRRLAAAGKVVVLTAASDPQVARDALAAGAAQVLRKPVTIAALAQALEEVSPAAAQTPEFTARMAALERDAAEAVQRRGRALIETGRAGGPCDPVEAHRLAGLAAQFGWAGVAAAADGLEAALKTTDGAADAAMAVLAAALDAQAASISR